MTLGELKQIQNQLESLANQARCHDASVVKIVSMRRTERDLFNGIIELTRYTQLSDPIRVALDNAVAHFRDDVFRIAEMDLERQARIAKAKAKAKQAQLDEYLTEPQKDPVP